MKATQIFRAVGQPTVIQFLDSFIKKISSEGNGNSDYAKIFSVYEDTIIFECTPETYAKIAKKMTNISVSITPI